MKAFPKRYIGDGAYIECNGWSLILTAENGIVTTDTVVIDMNDIGELKRALIDAGVLEGGSRDQDESPALCPNDETPLVGTGGNSLTCPTCHYLRDLDPA